MLCITWRFVDISESIKASPTLSRRRRCSENSYWNRNPALMGEEVEKSCQSAVPRQSSPLAVTWESTSLLVLAQRLLSPGSCPRLQCGISGFTGCAHPHLSNMTEAVTTQWIVPRGRHGVLSRTFLRANLLFAAVVKLLTVNVLSHKHVGGAVTVWGVVWHLRVLSYRFAIEPDGYTYRNASDSRSGLEFAPGMKTH